MKKLICEYRLVANTIVVSACVYVLGGILFYTSPSTFIYWDWWSEQTNFYECKKLGRVAFKNLQGTHAYYYEAKGSPYLVVYYPGTNLTACDRDYYDKIFRKEGISYLLVEYSGYDINDMRPPARFRILEDVKHVIAFVDSLPYRNVIPAGHSLGTGYACEHVYSSDRPVGVILLSPFPRLSAVGERLFPFYPVRWVLLQKREELDNIWALREYKKNILVIHGEDDWVIPEGLGWQLYKSVQASQKFFLRVAGYKHVRLLNARGVPETIVRFIKTGNARTPETIAMVPRK